MSKQEEASPQDSQHHTNDRSEDHITTKTKGVAELALLYIGIPGVTLYPLGLLALLIQLLRDPQFPFYDPVTAWTAISVIPQTVVIGTGISLTYTSLVAALAGLEVYYLTLLLLHLWQKRKNPSSGSEDSSTRRERRRVLRWSLYLLPLLPLALIEGLGNLDFDRPGDIFVFVGFIVFSCGGGALAGYIRDRRYPRGAYSGFVVGYIGALLAALCLSGWSEPALPQVERETAQEVGAPLDCSQASDKDRFVLLAQSGPYWHVYNKEGLFAFTMDTTEHIRFRDTLNSRTGETLITECPEEEGA